jgi:hypothetical protein
LAISVAPTGAPTSSPLYQNAMTIQPAGQFELDAMNDNLPTVSWLFPTSTQSEHPDYLPAAGAAFVASKIDAIAANPEVWAKTVFLLPDTSGPLTVAQYTSSQFPLPPFPGADQTPPVQPKGHRPHVP